LKLQKTGMKTIYIVRHAKARRRGDNSEDFSRALTEEGKQDAHRLGLFLRSKNVLPDLIVSSTAKRAIRTAQILADEIKYPRSEIDFNDSLYEIEVDDLLKILYNLNDSYQSVMFVGHNPPMSIMADYLTRYGVGNLSPGSIFGCEFKTDTWKTVSKYSGLCKFLETPQTVRQKLLKN